ncbi:hypothetical protein C8Q80DRAFT_1160889 [Daedaleopsis nitida]|nr:hypothetical protein C8Q80DRAFT_1160889 [Daedaleopsis nitida]
MARALYHHAWLETESSTPLRASGTTLQELSGHTDTHVQETSSTPASSHSTRPQIQTLSALQAFSVADTVHVCHTSDSTTKELGYTAKRVLVPNGDGNSDTSTFTLVPYTTQRYVAISYCWPSESFRCLAGSNEPSTVRIDGASVVSRHFSKFIAQAVQCNQMPAAQPTDSDGSAGERLAVWLDYHCIDQADEAEKMDQVAIMQQIYAQAETTLIVLEDLALAPDELAVLLRFKKTDDYVSLVRRILAARWFTRAWCSQELVLSREARFYFHNTSDLSGPPLLIDSSSLWHCLDIARRLDSTVPLYSQPRGNLVDGPMSMHTTAWALNIVRHLGCSDEYDKVSLICNLLRYAHRFAARPTAFGESGEAVTTVRLNVLKMANVLAIGRRDFSLLLANHGIDNVLRGTIGFGWAGVPVQGDRVSEVWVEKDYDVARDPDTAIDGTALVVRGVVAMVVREHLWEIYRVKTGLYAKVDGTALSVVLDYPTHPSWTWTHEAQRLRDVLAVLTSAADMHGADSDVTTHARAVIAYLLAEPDYCEQPAPFTGDAPALLRGLLAETARTLENIARAMSFVWRSDGRASFSTVLLSEGSILLVGGNAPQGELCGKVLFQPFVVRPKLFSPPSVLTANSMVLDAGELPDGTRRCMGCVRGLGMVLETTGAAQRLRIV